MVLVTIAIASIVLYAMFQAKPALQPIRIKSRDQRSQEQDSQHR